MFGSRVQGSIGGGLGFEVVDVAAAADFDRVVKKQRKHWEGKGDCCCFRADSRRQCDAGRIASDTVAIAGGRDVGDGASRIIFW